MRKVLLITGVIVMAGGVFFYSRSKGSANSTNASPMPLTYTMAQVAAHSSGQDCWTAIEGNVYNISKYVSAGVHPGGPRILQACGVDATPLFTGTSPMGRVHSSSARAILARYKIGTLK